MDNPSAGEKSALVAPTAGEIAVGNRSVDSMPLATQVWFNEDLYKSVTRAASMMAGAEGFVSKSLIGRTETCFAVALTALDCGLNPFMLAQGAYQTPDGKVGYETKAVQAIVEAKGFFSKPPGLEFTGPWDGLIGKHKMDGKVAKKTWTPEDAKGCKLQVTFYFTDLKEPVVCEPMDLAEVGTHFSTGWALEPKNQFTRLVIRRQLQLKRPSILAGVRCIEDLYDEAPAMRDVTPPKDGNAGLDAFAAAKPSETVVEPCEPAKADPAPDDEPKPEPAKAEQQAPITVWASADEPAREIKSLPNAAFVLEGLIKDAKTQPMAMSIINQNIDLITRIDNAAGSTAFSSNLDAMIERKSKGGHCTPENGQLV